MYTPSIFNDHFAETLRDAFFNDPFWPVSSTARTAGSLMNTDVRETEGGYNLEMELPGFAKEDIQAELKDGYLTIQASHTEDKDQKDADGKYLRKERYSGSCSRSFYVGEDVTQEDIKAKFADGILTLFVPKKEEQPKIEERKYIAIGE